MRWLVGVGFSSLALAAVDIDCAYAQEAAPSTDAAAALSLQPAYNSAQGLNVGGVLVFPSLFLGGVFNSNVYGTARDPKAALGFSISPALTAIDDQGLHKTSFYFNATADLYPGVSSTGQQTSPNTIVGSVGIDHVWKPTPDVIVDANASYSRQDNAFGSVNTGSLSFVTTPAAINVAPFQQNSNLAVANLSVEKDLSDGFFVRGGIGAQGLSYDPPPTGFVGSLDNIGYSAFLRGGYRITPQVNAFVEVDDNVLQYQNSWYNSNSYRVIGGLSSDLIGLFKGEIYAGAQEQYSLNGNFDAVWAPAFGASLFYYPTRYLTFAATVDDSFGSAAVQSVGTPASPSSTTTEARFQGIYQMFEYWSATAFAGYAQTDFSDSPQRNNSWTAGAALSYNFWRNTGVSLNYQYLQTSSNIVSTPGYSQNIVTAGVTYRY